MLESHGWLREPDPTIDLRSSARLKLPSQNRYRLAALLSRLHRSLYVFFNGRFLSRRGDARFLLLSARGRRSNRVRTVALLYVLQDGNPKTPSVIASFGGNPKAPAWLLNIRNYPQVQVQIGADKWEGTARISTEEERDQLWPRFIDCYSGYQSYQARTTRRFPIVIITRDED